MGVSCEVRNLNFFCLFLITRCKGTRLNTVAMQASTGVGSIWMAQLRDRAAA